MGGMQNFPYLTVNGKNYLVEYLFVRFVDFSHTCDWQSQFETRCQNLV